MSYIPDPSLSSLLSSSPPQGLPSTSCHTYITLLSYILHPHLTQAEFFSDYWQQRPFYGGHSNSGDGCVNGKEGHTRRAAGTNSQNADIIIPTSLRSKWDPFFTYSDMEALWESIVSATPKPPSSPIQSDHHVSLGVAGSNSLISSDTLLYFRDGNQRNIGHQGPFFAFANGFSVVTNRADRVCRRIHSICRGLEGDLVVDNTGRLVAPKEGMTECQLQRKGSCDIKVSDQGEMQCSSDSIDGPPEYCDKSNIVRCSVAPNGDYTSTGARSSVSNSCSSVVTGEVTSFPFVYCNVYLTPPGSQSVPKHNDDREVILLQIHGEKEWIVYSPPLPSSSLSCTADVPHLSSHSDESGESTSHQTMIDKGCVSTIYKKSETVIVSESDNIIPSLPYKHEEVGKVPLRLCTNYTVLDNDTYHRDMDSAKCSHEDTVGDLSNVSQEDNTLITDSDGRTGTSPYLRVVLRCTLRAGEFLYIPRGYVHEARATAGSSSLHLTLALQSSDWDYSSLLQRTTNEVLLDFSRNLGRESIEVSDYSKCDSTGIRSKSGNHESTIVQEARGVKRESASMALSFNELGVPFPHQRRCMLLYHPPTQTAHHANCRLSIHEDEQEKKNKKIFESVKQDLFNVLSYEYCMAQFKRHIDQIKLERDSAHHRLMAYLNPNSQSLPITMDTVLMWTPDVKIEGIERVQMPLAANPVEMQSNKWATDLPLVLHCVKIDNTKRIKSKIEIVDSSDSNDHNNANDITDGCVTLGSMSLSCSESFIRVVRTVASARPCSVRVAQLKSACSTVSGTSDDEYYAVCAANYLISLGLARRIAY